MNLRFKRNLPIVITLVGILAVLAFVLGSYPIIAYNH